MGDSSDMWTISDPVLGNLTWNPERSSWRGTLTYSGDLRTGIEVFPDAGALDKALEFVRGPDKVRPGLGISNLSLKPLKRSPRTPCADSSRCVALPQY